MIVLDPSAAIAVITHEDDAALFTERLIAAERVLMAAPSRLELFMVLSGRKRGDAHDAIDRFMTSIGIKIVAFDLAQARIAEAAFLRYGKGRHPAGLNFGDCITYALARSRGLPLLFKGGDFAQTDVVAAV